MPPLLQHFLILALCLAATPTFALEDTGLRKSNAYKEVRTSYEQFLSGKPSKAQRLDYMRKVLIESKLGSSGFEKLYHNFGARYSIDPSIPGVEKSVLLATSGSQSQAKGYRRELLYGVAIHNDPRYKLEAMNKPLSRKWGNTDTDISFRLKTNGQFGRIEVKDYSVDSQVTNFRKLKVQIDKMAREGRYTGQPQIWMNHRGVHPALYQYATNKGILVLGNVSTGGSLKGNTISATEALDRVEHESIRASRTKTALSSIGTVFGISMVLDSAPNAWNDLQAARNANGESKEKWLRFGVSGSQLFTGTAMVVSGSSILASSFVGEGMQGKLYRVGRAGGYASLVGLGMTEAFLVSRYLNGDVTSREFWTEQALGGVMVAGSSAGYMLGKMAGAVIPIPFASVPTGMLGSYLGLELSSKFGQRILVTYYDWIHPNLDENFGKYVYQCYGLEGGVAPCREITFRTL